MKPVLESLVAALKSWPLFLVGLIVIAWGVVLSEGGDESVIKGLLVLGAVVLGAGLALVVLRYGIIDSSKDQEE